MASWYERTETTGDLITDQTLTTGATYSYSGDVFSKLMRPEYVLITMKATGAGATTALVDFNWIARADESDPWPTVATFTTQLTLDGTNAVVAVSPQLIKSYAEIKLLSIKNNAAVTVNLINCRISWKV